MLFDSYFSILIKIPFSEAFFPSSSETVRRGSREKRQKLNSCNRNILLKETFDCSLLGSVTQSIVLCLMHPKNGIQAGSLRTRAKYPLQSSPFFFHLRNYTPFWLCRASLQETGHNTLPQVLPSCPTLCGKGTSGLAEGRPHSLND